jgi:hypothetical protein
MNRMFLAGAATALTLCAAAFGAFHTIHDAKAAADKTLGAALMSATVDLDGTLVRGAGAVSSMNTGNTGDFVVQFNRDVRDCTYVASVGSPVSPVGWTANAAASAPGNASGPDTVRVFISTNGAGVNNPFHLLVVCHK